MAPSGKREQILTMAGNLFLEEGFLGLSMDRLAAAVPVSKPTLYAHFADKDALFAAVVSAKCQTALADLTADMLLSAPTPAATLTRFGANFTAMLYRTEALRFHRMMIAEAERVPDLTRLFYESGPAKVRQLLEDYLRALHRAGPYRIPHPDRSADLFIGMFRGPRHLRCLLGLETLPSAAARKTMVADAVQVFLHGHRGKAN